MRYKPRYEDPEHAIWNNIDPDVCSYTCADGYKKTRFLGCVLEDEE
jgi:hypothetical protein